MQDLSLEGLTVPQHVAIVMDGNGRWARQRMLPRSAGHRQGIQTVRRVCDAAEALGVKYLTVYAFSTENWRRPEAEVRGLMDLIRRTIRREVKELDRRGVQVRVSGDLPGLPDNVRSALEEGVAATAHNSGLVLNLAINYGARTEITHAARRLAEQVAQGKLTPEQITEDLVSANLYTAGLPDPELLIRTGGELRVSNFLLWQIAYSEIYVTDVLWPDFSEADLRKAIIEFNRRERRFGAVPT